MCKIYNILNTYIKEKREKKKTILLKEHMFQNYGEKIGPLRHYAHLGVPLREKINNRIKQTSFGVANIKNII